MNPLSQVRSWIERRRHNALLRSISYIGGGAVPAAPVLSGTFITPETALGLAAVFCSVNVISRDIAVMPWHVYRRLPGGGREIDFSHPVEDLISTQPNNEMDAFRYKQTEMSHVLTRGNGFSEIVRDPRNGSPVALEILHPSKTLIKRTDGGSLYYELDNKKKLAPENVLHLAGMGFNGVMGYSPITLMRQTIGLSMGSEQYGAAFFGNSARTSGWIKLAKRLDERAINNLRKTFNQIHQGSQSAHQVGILEEGMDFVNSQFSPEDSQFLQTREFQVKDIARIFSIPPHKIGDYSESHLANVEEANLDYVAMTLLGWVLMIEGQGNMKLLTREERKTHEIGVDMSILLRGNVQARMLRIQTLRNTGAICTDEIRISEGFNPIGPAKGGDKFLVQAQYIPLDQVGKSPAVPAKSDGTRDLSELLGRLNGFHAGVNHE